MAPHRLLCILAHPDDESLGLGGTLAVTAANGVDAYLVTATRGERGWQGDSSSDPGPGALAVLREAELHAAAAVLGIRHVDILGYPDGGVAQVDQLAAIAHLVEIIRRVRPQVVITFPPDGVTGHPDHIAISQFAAAAVVCAADSGYGHGQSHRVTKLYYLTASHEATARYDRALASQPLTVDGQDRRLDGWPAWSITTRIDATGQWQRVWRAVACHQTQLIGLEVLANLSMETHRLLWGTQELYRVYSAVPVPAGEEHDLFTGIASPARSPPGSPESPRNGTRLHDDRMKGNS